MMGPVWTEGLGKFPVGLPTGAQSHGGKGTPARRIGSVDLSNLKDITEIVRSFATVAAILVGGVWSYMLFVRTRQRYPRAKIKHEITHRVLSDDKALLHIAVNINNSGDVLLSVVSAQTRIQQVLPTPPEILDSVNQGLDPVQKGKTEIEWPLIGTTRKSHWAKGKREIEPGESDELHYDFVLDSRIQTVEVYTYVKNATKRGREIGWSLTTLYDLPSAS